MAGGRWLANAVPGDAAVRAAVLGSAVLGAAVDRRPTTDLRHAGLRAASRPAAAPAQAWSRRADPFGAERAAAHRAGRHDRAICQQEWPLPRREADGRRAGLDDLRSGQEDLETTKRDLSGSQNLTDELKRQKQVIRNCIDLSVKAAQARRSGNTAQANALDAQAETVCDEAFKYLSS